EFENVLGLVPSIHKTAAFFCNVPNAIKAAILNSMSLAKVLVEKLESRITDWKNKFLSLVGRLKLVRSVLSSMHIYWASVFILLACIVHDLEQLMRVFLWCQGEMKRGKAKVALIGNLKVHEMIIKKDSKIVKAKGERKSLALKAKKESSEEECSTSESKDEEYVMAVRDSRSFLFFFQKKGEGEKRCGDSNHLIGECPKPPKEKNQRAFVGGSRSDSGEEDDEKAKYETCLVAQAYVLIPLTLVMKIHQLTILL
ncbi:hypothetical protein Tco_1097064, partial [Tanacetum coccineum]